VLRAGEVVNVVPREASALVDVRLGPGSGDVLGVISRLLGPGVDIEVIDWAEPLEAPAGSPAFATMAASLLAEDPDGVVAPFLVSGGTDAKAFAQLGIASYGFSPMWLPAGFDLYAQFHADDERLPVAALEFGARVMDRVLLTV
jgi:acetylornithine deacetylase/succinyl-diaminopimelate desuccinylase-like protein